MDHHIQIEHFGDESDRSQSQFQFPYTSYYDTNNSIELDLEAVERDRFDRLSNSSTLVGGTSPLRHPYSPEFNSNNSYFIDDFKSNGNTIATIATTTTTDTDINATTTITSASVAAPAITVYKARRRKYDGTDENEKKKTNGSLWYRFFYSEGGRLTCAVVYFVVICIGMAFCNQLSDHRWVNTGYTDVLLRDRGFDVIEAQADIQPANTFVMTSVVFTVLGIGLICPNWTMRGIVLRRILWVIGTLSAFRALTLSVTTLPTPKEECRPSLKTGFWDMFIVALQMIPGTVEACTDDIFSGHTVFMVSCAIQWRLYCRNKWVTYFSYLYISIGLYYVIATRLHYTVDVVLAIFITFAGWSVYICMIDVVMEEEYFGIKSHHEKYAVFNTAAAEYEFVTQEQDRAIDEEDEEVKVTISSTTTSTTSTLTPNPTKSQTISSRRKQLEYHMNRLRGPRIGYGRGEYDRVAFVPMQFNLWLKNVVRWCDGLDLRMNPYIAENPSTGEQEEEEGLSSLSSSSRWNELVVRYRAELASITGARCDCKKTDGELENNLNGYNELGRHREMVQVYRSGSGLESVHIHNYMEERGQQQHGRWRSMALRTSPRSRSPDLKAAKAKKMERNRKLFVLKIALVIFVNVILLIKVIETVQNNSSAAASSSQWPTEMKTYPGGTIYNNNNSYPNSPTSHATAPSGPSSLLTPSTQDEEHQVQASPEESEVGNDSNKAGAIAVALDDYKVIKEAVHHRGIQRRNSVGKRNLKQAEAI
ncbi:hypothetical protein BX616_007249 [Lobosporangium transversale]|uniref:Sphingomyelin synthase-like domain-containing protein n=1 Tax=Lobosporangium transversale TaxID=64571 RepID=A0A1Y2GHY0_9FUNG|nr:hypothetical protein BCR41DRAFT_387827 [Lobosporangium transversale]KAF9914945.1 hypothetical protein BX616_007249 [Lobosporangium transversale]ORZ11390.1 hypothetical protein BCR41DRAFT_387827 [Lobosporangium transversale]|eukprot:XP_021879705.1 hypothetical protein BCR41DRAFT_387827 [Lobosporangium transversale]